MKDKINIGMPQGNYGLGIKPGMGVGFQLPQDMQFANFPQQMNMQDLMLMLQQNPYLLSNGMPQMQQLPSGGLLGPMKQQ